MNRLRSAGLNAATWTRWTSTPSIRLRTDHGFADRAEPYHT